MSEDKGLRANAGKSRIDLAPSDAMLHVGEVLAMGAEKYDERNWEHGMAYSKVVSSLERHLAKWKAGEDLDDESKLHHIDHVMCNALFLSRYVRAFPEKDDRFIPYIMNNKRIGLDIDGVLADFSTAFCKKMGLTDRGNQSWYMSYKAKDPVMWKKLLKDKKFWMELKPLIDPNTLIFEPVAYVTARGIPIEWTEEWLEMNGFPCNEVVMVSANGGEHEPKINAIKEREIDIFVDDHYKNFIELNQAGIKCYLQDSYHNRRFQVGALRVDHPNDVIKNLTI
jgi:uncharacterized HAD superfamily protein